MVNFGPTSWTTRQLEGVAVDRDGYVYATEVGGYNEIYKFTPSLTYLTTFGGSGTGSGKFSTPLGLAVDGNNRLYVTDSGNKLVQVFAYPDG